VLETAPPRSWCLVLPADVRLHSVLEVAAAIHDPPGASLHITKGGASIAALNRAVRAFLSHARFRSARVVVAPTTPLRLLPQGGDRDGE
jgi:hypothetical protein